MNSFLNVGDLVEIRAADEDDIRAFGRCGIVIDIYENYYARFYKEDNNLYTVYWIQRRFKDEVNITYIKKLGTLDD